MIRKRGTLYTFARLFINNFIMFYLIYTVSIIFQILCNTYLNTSLSINYDTGSYYFIFLISITFSLMMISGSIRISKAIRIDEKSIDENRIKAAMSKMKWTMRDYSEDAYLFNSPLGFGMLKEEMIIKFVETEIHISGPRRNVDDFIRLAKFPYASFEITINEQEAKN